MWRSSLLCFFVSFMIAGLSAPWASGLDAVWVTDGQSRDEGTLTLHFETTGAFPAVGETAFRCHVDAPRAYEEVQFRFVLEDMEGAVVAEAVQFPSLALGQNEVVFRVDNDQIPLGDYRAVIFAMTTVHLPEQVVWRGVRRLSSDAMAAAMEIVENRLDAMQASLDTAAGAAGEYPYSRVRMRIAQYTLEETRRAFAAEAWEEAVANVDYLLRAAFAVETGIVFSGVTPELRNPVALPDAATARVGAGGFVAGVDEHPVFLFGRKLHTNRPADLDWLDYLGLSLAVVEDDAGLQGLVEHARNTNVALAVQMNPAEVAAAAQTPLTPSGFPDIASPDAQAAFAAHLDAVVPVLSAHEKVLLVSLSKDPRFQIYSPAIHRAFIDHVKAEYPDRQTLNQTWHAHFASYDEIAIWDRLIDGTTGVTFEDHQYPNRRAYQYDWQRFHRELAVQYFQWARSVARQDAPRLPLAVTVPDSLFELGETRFGVDREALAALMDVTACTSFVETDDEFYAMNYPRQAAFYTYMRSLEPLKPVVNMDKQIQMDPALSGRETYQYVRSVLWEALIEGVNGIAIGNDAFFEHPDALEALAVTNLDAQRLAPIITAFHQAGTEVGIVFSNSAKILDDGVPHLDSAQFAYEGASFSGYKLRYITEDHIRDGILDTLEAIVLPETPAMDNEAFDLLDAFVEEGGVIARVGTPIPYAPRGSSRTNVLRNTPETVLVRGMNLPTEYLHALDALIDEGDLKQIARPVNAHGYPLEGVKTRYVEHDGKHYIYVLNLRPEAAHCYLTGGQQSGRDLLTGQHLRFPRMIAPLTPMLVQLESNINEVDVQFSAAASESDR